MINTSSRRPLFGFKQLPGIVLVKIKVVTLQRPLLCLIFLYVDFPSGNYKERGQAEEWREDIKAAGSFFFFFIWGLNLEESGKIESGESGADKSG